LDSGSGEDAGGDDGGAPDAGPIDAGPTLDVFNFAGWCSISVDGGAFVAGGDVTGIPVNPGDTISLGARPNPASIFKLGLWHHTAGDTGSGDPGSVSGGTSTTSRTVGPGYNCVWVCCPFTNG